MKYDVIIIGAGSAGLSARSEVKKITDNYLVVDGGELGTTCARTGCMPSKVLIEAANIFHQSTKFKSIGVSGSEKLSLSSSELMEHVRKLRDYFVSSVLKSTDRWTNTHFLKGYAKFVSSDAIEVNGQRLEAKNFIIATGSRPIVPDVWSPLRDSLLTSDNFFEQMTLPSEIAVIGAGAIGLELAQAMARLQVRVHLFGKGESFGGLTDPDFSSLARKRFEGEMNFFNEEVTSLEKLADGFELKWSTGSLKVPQVLVAVGRSPNLERLNLNVLGLKLDVRGNPIVDEKTGRIPGSNIFIAGDSSPSLPILHEAVDEGRIAGFNSVRETDKEFKRHVRLTITFTTPQISIVGKSFEELRAENFDFVSGSVSFADQGRARTKFENFGMIKVYGDRCSGEILGAELFAPEAEHLAHILAFAIEKKSSVFELLKFPFYHPTIEEGLRTALRSMSKEVEVDCKESDSMRCQDPPVAP